MKYSPDQITWYDDVYDVFDVLALYDSLSVGVKYYKGVEITPKASAYFNVEDFLNRFDEIFFDECGHVVEDASIIDSLSERQVKEFELLIKTWLDDNCVVPIFLVKDIQECFVTEADLE